MSPHAYLELNPPVRRTRRRERAFALRMGDGQKEGERAFACCARNPVGLGFLVLWNSGGHFAGGHGTFPSERCRTSALQAAPLCVSNVAVIMQFAPQIPGTSPRH